MKIQKVSVVPDIDGQEVLRAICPECHQVLYHNPGSPYMSCWNGHGRLRSTVAKRVFRLARIRWLPEATHIGRGRWKIEYQSISIYRRARRVLMTEIEWHAAPPATMEGALLSRVTSGKTGKRSVWLFRIIDKATT